MRSSDGLNVVSGGKWRLCLGDSYLFYCHPGVTDGYTPCPISDHAKWIYQISEDMKCPGVYHPCCVWGIRDCLLTEIKAH